MESTHPDVWGNPFGLKDSPFFLLKPAETGRAVPLMSYEPIIRTTRKEKEKGQGKREMSMVQKMDTKKILIIEILLRTAKGTSE